MTITYDDQDRMFDLEEDMGLELGALTLGQLVERYQALTSEESLELADPRVLAHVHDLEMAIDVVLQAIGWDYSIEYFIKILYQKTVFAHLHKAMVDQEKLEREDRSCLKQ